MIGRYRRPRLRRAADRAVNGLAPTPPLEAPAPIACNRYEGRRIAIATKHDKHLVLDRAFRHGLGASLVLAGVDTDQLGTFTGDVARPGPPADVVVRKARLGMAAASLPIGLASEASFFPYPPVPVVQAHHELLSLVDDELAISVTESIWSLKTNHAATTLGVGDDYRPFLTRVGFDTHALVVRPHPGDGPIIKGIVTVAGLTEAIAQAAERSPDAKAMVETDMRAHHNRSRRLVLRHLGYRLVRRLRLACPGCGLPGWGRTETVTGLPCEQCATPTAEPIGFRDGCPHCGLTGALHRTAASATAEPARCPYCNP